ncbi:hypothetical protein QE418_003377 [Microbacterium testaceum]|uniref:hypothetical protein n=1 Tax=Microbacterium TaxID=33882 RepID=UPI00278510A9|nr:MULTISPECIES: hypothetical protein [Microbacterium]MDQ1113929.1 hypothetical protein [Microbacterium testaceum]MDR6098964.1 hypothetical protein [Microbacterium sp. SORGH_AS_0454]
MAFNPGRNIGRVSIRVVPDTKDFNKDVRRDLERSARDVRARVKVEGADFDREAVKRDLEKQLNDVRGLRVDAYVKATVDSAKVNKVLVRKSLQKEFDEMGLRVQIEAHIANHEEFKHEVHKLVHDASKEPVDVHVKPHTAEATSRLKWLARTRVVNYLVKVNDASVVKAAATLAALSGARIAGNWLDDIQDMARNLDKNLPKILGWTTGVTSAIAALTSLGGGIVSIGEGLFSISPMLLAVPGLAINAVGSLIALIVAWKDAGNQLSPLADGMNELGEIINTTYWDRARQPILDLVNGLMPQLRNAFRELSDGVGEFTGALADAFGEELSGGRLESIFGGIAEGWRVLGTGASGFAGAIVSLSQIAATYTPRLAAWFVRQANTFDAWLEAIAKDGRLGDWMEDAIKNMYALWDATAGLAGVFAGIFRAAEAAGSTGLIGFADLMRRWQDVVNTSSFQRGLTAVFRGSYAAMDAFGDAIKAIGRMIADLSGPVERFIGGAGGFLGGLVEGIANALNSPTFGRGLDEFTKGLAQALDGIKPSLQPIADTFGGFVGLLGDMAGSLLPAAAQVIADLTPAFNGIIDAVKPVLPDLANALSEISTGLGPAIADLVSAVGPVFQDVVTQLSQALVDVAPAVGELAKVLSDVVRSLTSWSESNKGFFDKLALDLTPDAEKWKVKVEQSADTGPLRGSTGFVLPRFDANDRASVDAYAKSIVQVYKDQLRKGGPAAGTAFLEGLKSVDMPGPIMDQLRSRFGPDLDQELNSRGREGGGKFSRGLAAGMDESPEASASVGRLRANLGNFTLDADTWMKPAGTAAMQGFRRGSEEEQPNVLPFFGALGGPIGDVMAGAASWLLGRGGETMGGFGTGASGAVEGAKSVFAGLNGHVTGVTNGAGGWLNGRGGEAMGGFASGAEGRKGDVRGTFGGLAGLVSGAIPNPFGLLVGAGSAIMNGLLSGLRSAYGNVQSFVRGIAGWIQANKGPEAYDRQLLVPAGGWIMGGFLNGLERGFGRVQSRVASMASDLREEFEGGLNGTLGDGVNVTAAAARSASLASAQPDGSNTSTGVPVATRSTHITFVNPVSRDPLSDAQEAADLVNAVG